MNRMRLRIAERLKESQNTAASLTTFQEVDMSSLMEMRNLYKQEILDKTGVKFGFMSAFSRAAVLALKAVPAVNASIDGNEIVYRDYVDISVAVATEKGLVTPVVRNVEAMDFITIEKSIAELAKKVRHSFLSSLISGSWWKDDYWRYGGWNIHHFQWRYLRIFNGYILLVFFAHGARYSYHQSTTDRCFGITCH